MNRQNSIPATIKEITGCRAVRQSGRGMAWYYIDHPTSEDYVRGFNEINEYIEKFKNSGIVDVYKLDKDVPLIGSDKTHHVSAYMFVIKNKKDVVIGSLLVAVPSFPEYRGALVLDVKNHDSEELEAILISFREVGTVEKQ